MKSTRRGRAVIKAILFWIFVLVCLMLLWGAISRAKENPPSEEATRQNTSNDSNQEPPSGERAISARALLVNVGPFVVLGGVWLFVLFRMMPMQLKRLSRNDPMMQGEFMVNVSPVGLATQNTAGTSGTTGWNLYEYWIEGKNVIVLALKSTAYFVICLRDLSDTQRGELELILGQALPKR